MQYLITFLEGIISFISPCMLPMLPMYISYFAGNSEKKRNTVLHSIAFVVGFTVVFSLLGVFAGTLGKILTRYQTVVNIVCGLIVIILGLSYMEILPLPFFKGMQNTKKQLAGLLSAFLFGMIYSVNLTPCVGAFLGSALMMASSAGSTMMGMLLLLTYSLGLGIPFVVSAILIEKLGDVFGWIKKHYRVINIVSGVFLIFIGVLMMTGLLRTTLSMMM